MIEHFHDWSWCLMMISGILLFLCIASLIEDRNNRTKRYATRLALVFLVFSVLWIIS